jgi:FtsP/CotA-like multicopper oxidase with cupredoxin domain
MEQSPKMIIRPRSKLIVIFPALCLSAASICPRPDTGGTVTPPPEITASNGHLRVAFSFRSQVDPYGLTRYCYIDENNVQAPTLRVKPGDEVDLDLKNDLPAGAPSEHHHTANSCSAGPITAASTNLHFHGLAIPPTCHQDEVIHTSIQPSEPAFQYRFRIPADQPPGLYWYHPHPHGYSEPQVLGGASGALIVEGIAKLKPEVAGLPERILILRDQRILGPRNQDDDMSGKDISLNFVPVMYPLYMPAVMRVKPDRREFWRVLNASADTYFNLQVITVENGARIPQNLRLIAMDGAPASGEVSDAPRTGILLSPGARAEFIVTTPHAGAFSQLVSRKYDTGPDGAVNSDRVIANIITGSNVDSEQLSSPNAASAWSFTGLANLRPARVRRLYFSEDREDLRTPGKPPKYFVTLEGKTPAVFDMNFKKPDITARQGTVEDWIVENRAREAHVFHIHQLHFQLLERDGVKVAEPMLRDTIDLPYWDGTSQPYPSIRLRMDFRAPEIVGTFLFHCHILEHEDAGMMGSVEVVKGR